MIGLLAIATVAAAVGADGPAPHETPEALAIRARVDKDSIPLAKWPDGVILVAEPHGLGTMNPEIELDLDIPPYQYLAATLSRKGSLSRFRKTALRTHPWKLALLLKLFPGPHPTRVYRQLDLVVPKTARAAYLREQGYINLEDLEQHSPIRAWRLLSKQLFGKTRAIEWGWEEGNWGITGFSRRQGTEHPLEYLERHGLLGDPWAQVRARMPEEERPIWINPAVRPTALDRAAGKHPLRDNLERLLPWKGTRD